MEARIIEVSTKQHIADCALSMFLENGFSNTTVRQIAECCNMSHVNVLKHFGSKADLGVAIVGDYIKGLIDTTKKQADIIGLVPSQQYSNLYWLSHYSFLDKHRNFAGVYCEIYESARSGFYNELTKLSVGGLVTSALFGCKMNITPSESELYSKLIVDADIHLIDLMLCNSYPATCCCFAIDKLLHMLLLGNTTSQITVSEIQKNLFELQPSVDNSISFLEMLIIDGKSSEKL